MTDPRYRVCVATRQVNCALCPRRILRGDSRVDKVDSRWGQLQLQRLYTYNYISSLPGAG